MEFDRERVIGEMESQIAYSKFINTSKVVLSADAVQFCLEHIQFYEQKIKELQNSNEELGKHCMELCREIERLSKSYTNLVPTLNELRIDTLNELITRLEIAVGTYTKDSYVYVSAWFKLINQIVEDMKKESANDRSGQSTN